MFKADRTVAGRQTSSNWPLSLIELFLSCFRMVTDGNTGLNLVVIHASAGAYKPSRDIGDNPRARASVDDEIA